MALVYADPDMLDRLAKSLDDKAGEIPLLKSRASTLGVTSDVSGLPAIATWLGETATDLRRRAKILRAPTESPFESLSEFGLPASLARKPGAGDKFDSGLKSILSAHKDGTAQEQAQAVKDYFATLSPEEQAALAVTDPSLVGNLDGVPPNVRFAANRISIQNEYTKESERLNGMATNDPVYKRTRARVDTLRSFLNPRIQKIRDPETGQPRELEVPRQFLVFDAEFGSTADPKASPFPDGRVAEVVGNLETAKNVAFRVPGITNRLDNFNGFTDGGYQLASDSRGFEQPDTAVVSWLGYDTPEIGDSVNAEKAEVGGRRLNAFRQGISVNLQPNARTSIFAHSYGTLVTSKALQNGLTNIDNVTFMGSPGLGPNIHAVADFHMPGTKFYVMRAKEDPVSYTQGHGDDPADFKDIIRLGTDGATGHSEYYKDGTMSLKNMRSVLFGGATALTFTHTTLDQEMPGAQEVRDLVAFLHEKVPPEVVNEMGADLDPIVQGLLNGRSKFTDVAVPIHSVLNKYNMLDRVKPNELMGEITTLASRFTYKQAYKAAKDKGAPDWLATTAASTAAGATKASLSIATWPAVKVMEFDRLQNNTGQLFGILDDGWKEISVDGAALANSFNRDAGRIAGAGADMSGSVQDTGGRILTGIGDSLLHPTHAFKNSQDIAKSLDSTRDSFARGGTEIAAAANDAFLQTVDKGGDMISSGLDTGKKALDKGGDVLDSVANFVF
ncbi:alpha/beta hydrolase [Streptomyces sp. NPDC059766]|uniref:alpha/beta hydrolase n=1 Tax=Streptomyces sp. NPDC059766 TaxID=3346940 RepID=UPI003667FC40